MNHNLVSQALCGSYTRLAENSGYIETNLPFPNEGSMIGAYVIDAGHGVIRITDDGDIAFNAAVGGANLTRERMAKYQELAERYGISFDTDGRLTAVCELEQLPYYLSKFVVAADAIAHASLKHRPQDHERFERLVGEVLDRQFADKVTRRASVIGISGHQLRFPFALNLQSKHPVLIQPIAAVDDELKWSAIYEAGGKFKDVRPARSNVRLVAVLEHANGIERAQRFFADTSDVVIFDGSSLPIAA